VCARAKVGKIVILLISFYSAVVLVQYALLRSVIGLSLCVKNHALSLPGTLEALNIIQNTFYCCNIRSSLTRKRNR